MSNHLQFGQGQHANGGWWDRAVGYEIYLRSFADSNNDGVGDLQGVVDRLDYLAWLGIDLVSLAPIFASPQVDFGYDVSNYCDVAAELGTLETLELLVEESHRRGIRLLLDLVPNHTSSQHRWFEMSRQSLDDEYRGYYHWRPPGPDGGPPNNWVSHFGGPAWTLDDETGQYYLHLFLPEQPDLNWNNPRVVREFDEILRFWLDRGVDGFRIDVAHGLVKNMLMPDNPRLRPVTDDMSPQQVFGSYDHRYDLDQDGSLDIFRRWRRLADDYDALLVGQVYLRDNDPSRVSRYVAGGLGLHRAFYSAPMHVPWGAEAVWNTFRDALDEAPVDLSWSPSSHDDPRAPTRFGGGALGQQRALAYSVLLMGMPGLPFLYQGDELGLEDAMVLSDNVRDPVALRNNGHGGRDSSRAPMPWDATAHNGFSEVQPWLVSLEQPTERTVEAQLADTDSLLHLYRELLLARRTIGQQHAELRWMAARSEPVVAFLVGNAIFAANLGEEPFVLPLLSGKWDVQFSSRGKRSLLPVSGSIDLAVPEGVILTRSSQTE